jgi:hypothetical protein
MNAHRYILITFAVLALAALVSLVVIHHPSADDDLGHFESRFQPTMPSAGVKVSVLDREHERQAGLGSIETLRPVEIESR